MWNWAESRLASTEADHRNQVIEHTARWGAACCERAFRASVKVLKLNVVFQALDKMEKEWSTILFNVMPYKETDTYILKSPDEASQLLDDHIVMTQSMSFSPYKKPFEQRINSWETKLKLTQVGLPALSSPTLPAPCPEVAPDDVRVGLDAVRCLAQVCPAPGSLTGPSVRPV